MYSSRGMRLPSIMVVSVDVEHLLALDTENTMPSSASISKRDS